MTPHEPSTRGRAVILTGLVLVAAASISVVVWRLGNRPDDSPKKPASKTKTGDKDKVLARLLGAWEVEAELIEPPDKERRQGTMEVTSVAQGNFLRIHTRLPKTTHESIAIHTFSAKGEAFQVWFFDGAGEAVGPSLSAWDADTQTLTWKTFPRGHASVYEIRFLNDNTAKAHLTVRDAGERIVLEMHQTLTRAEPGKTPPQALDPKRPKEMEVLESFVLGRWTTSATQRKFKPPEESKLTTALECAAILRGWFLEGRETAPPGEQEDYWLTTFDPDAKKYRFWSFASSGQSALTEGTYDAGSKTMLWKGVPKEDQRGTWKRLDADRQEISITFLENGEPVAESQGERRREK